MSDFIKGLQLNENFYNEVVAAILNSDFPDLKYSAGLIGWGSEVLGYDDVLSADHNWGLRFQIFLSAEDHEKYYLELNQILDEKLPHEYKSHPTSFEINVNKDQRDLERAKLSKHNIDIETIEGFFARYLGCDPFQEITVADWLTFTEHKLLAVTSGKVFYEGLGKLEEIRQKFKYYPRDIWLYLLSVQWSKIFEEQVFIGRCGYTKDELGSRLIAGKQIRNLMELCFLIEQKYAPYSKWFGTAFSQLDCADELIPIFADVLDSQKWKERQTVLADAYKKIIIRYNNLKITDSMSEEISEYFSRPFLVIKDESVVENLRKEIADKETLNIKDSLGSVNQFIDSDDKLNDVLLIKKLKKLYK